MMSPSVNEESLAGVEAAVECRSAAEHEEDARLHAHFSLESRRISRDELQVSPCIRAHDAAKDLAPQVEAHVADDAEAAEGRGQEEVRQGHR